MKSKLIKWGMGAIALLFVAGLSFGAVTTAQASDSWLGNPSVVAGVIGGPRGGEFGQRGGSLATIAKTLGVSESDLMTALQGGKTVADVAKEKGVDLSKVVDALVAEQTDMLKQAVTNGRLTQQQADARVAKLKADLPTMLSTKMPARSQGFGPREGFGPRGGGMGPFGSMATIATTLGISETTLSTEIQSGKTVADVAKEKGVDLSKVVDAIVTERTAALKQAVTNGRLTQQQADDQIAKLKTDLPTRLSTKMPTRPQNFGPGKAGRMGPFGSMATIATTLGISETVLSTELQGGKSVADVATEKGVDLSKVVDAIVAEQTTALKQAVTSGRLTQQRADQMIALLKANLPHLLSLKHGADNMGPGRHFRGRGAGQPGTQNQQSGDANPMLTPSQSA